MIYRLILYIFTLLCFANCVSTSKYNELALAKDSSDLEVGRLKAMEKDYHQLQLDFVSLQTQSEVDHKALKSLVSKYDHLNKTFNDLTQKYDIIVKDKESILENSSLEKQELVSRITAKDQLIEKKQREIWDLEMELENRKNKIDNLSSGLNSKEKQINDLLSVLRKQRRIMDSVKTVISNALAAYSLEDLSVSERDGKVYISLSQDLLFAKGSDQLNNEGKEAIMTLAKILSNNPELEVTVEGHTDTDGSDDLNWDLSVTRATSVIKYLTTFEIDPRRILASGRSSHFPIDSLDTEASKSKNRRVEIILTPKIDAILEILKTDF